MFCTNCGRENREQAKFCIYCGTRLETDAGDTLYEYKSTGRIRKKRRYGITWKRKSACRLVMAAVLIVVAGILLRSWYLKSMKREKVREYASEAATIIMDGDMRQIQRIIFGYEESEQADNLEEEEDGQQGILQALFSRDKIEVKEIKKSEIIFEIIAPDMSKVFAEMNEENVYLQDDFSEYIHSCILQAETMESRVSVPYRIEDGAVIADFKSEDFMNAVTGGLLQSYETMLQTMIEAYTGEET